MFFGDADTDSGVRRHTMSREGGATSFLFKTEQMKLTFSNDIYMIAIEQ